MAKVRTIQQFITIEHPNFPELKVKCRKLEPVEAMDLLSSLDQYKRVTAVLHPSTKEPIRNAANELETVSILAVPASAIVDLLGEVISGWEGMEDENDNTIPYTKSNIKRLFQQELNVKEADTEVSFADYIQTEFNKETLDNIKKENVASPKKKTSLKRV